MGFNDKKIDNFISELGSAAPVPGGGGAAALACGIGEALSEMVISLTEGKKKYECFSDELDVLKGEAIQLEKDFLELITEDGKGFEPLSKAYGLPAKTENERAEKEIIMEEALEKACIVPLLIMEKACRGIEIADQVSKKGSRLAVSDAGVSAMLLGAGLRSAALNIYINTKLMKNRETAEDFNQKADGMILQYGEMADEIYNRVKDTISKKREETVSKEPKAKFRGKPAADIIKEDVKKRSKQLIAKGNKPALAILRVGDNPSDIAYERSIVNQAEKVGIEIKAVHLPDDTPESKVIAVLDELSRYHEIDGIMPMRPLPSNISDELVREHICYKKDVDGITDISAAGVFTQSGKGFLPCTAEAALEILKFYGVNPEGKKVAVIGRSQVIGKPVAMLLLKENATVTICHSRTLNLKEICLSSDIIISAAGKAGLLTADMVKPDTAVVDVSVNFDENGNMIGDAASDVIKVTENITPVPGGVGAVTTAVLLRHVIEAAENDL